MAPADTPAVSTLALPKENLKIRTPGSTVGPHGRTNSGYRLVSTKELSKMWDMPESSLRYWRCAGIGPAYVKLGGRIKYDLSDVEAYVRANKRKPSVRAHGG
jgi:hypothetical protein